MKSGSDIISAIHHLKMSDEHLHSFIRDRPTASLARSFKRCRSRVAACFTDIKSEPDLPPIVSAGINNELNSDIFAVPAICEKVALLTPNQREFIEAAIEHLLSGEEITVELSKETV